VVALRMARRRERVRRRAATPRPSSGVADPAALERAAAAAERAGDLRGAIRLRFQAGLLRLDRARVIEWRPSLTTAEIARSVRSPEFASLARRFDEIVYGGRVPLPEDAATARRGWAELIEGA
jgi:hypothetical protein